MAEKGIVQLSNGVSQNALITGIKCWCRAGNSVSDCQKIGFVDQMRGQKQIGLQKAKVCGALLAASIDPESIDVSINLSGFVATPAVYSGDYAINGVGKVSLASFNPKSEDFIQGAVAVKFPYMDFYDEKRGIIIASFDTVISSSFSVVVNGGTYVKADIQLEAIDMSSGSEYQAQAGNEADLNQSN